MAQRVVVANPNSADGRGDASALPRPFGPRPAARPRLRRLARATSHAVALHGQCNTRPFIRNPSHVTQSRSRRVSKKRRRVACVSTTKARDGDRYQLTTRRTATLIQAVAALL